MSSYARCTGNTGALRWRARVQRKSLGITDAAVQQEEADADILSRMGTKAMRHCTFEKSLYQHESIRIAKLNFLKLCSLADVHIRACVRERERELLST